MHIQVAGDELQTKAPGATVWTARTLPTGVTVRTPRPTFAKHARASLINGVFDPGVIYRDNLDLFNKVGIGSPASAPTMVDGGAGNLNGIQIGYTSLVQYSGATLVHQGNLSTGSTATANLVNRDLDWSGLLTAAPAGSERATHLRLWRSVDGALPKFVVDLDWATLLASGGTYTDNITALGVTPPVNSDGTLNSGSRGVPPYGLFCIVWMDRMWVFGDPEYPYRAWYSLIGEPESFDIVDQFVDTVDRESITGAGVQDNMLILFGTGVMYRVSAHLGPVGIEFTIKKITASMGAISHHSIVNINHRLWFAAMDGVGLYDGTPRYMMRDLQSYWREDYKLKPTRYQDSIALNDKYYSTYTLLIPCKNPGDTPWWYIGHYAGVDPAMEGGQNQPDWSFDDMDRDVYTIGTLYGDTERREDYYCGGADGYLRRMNVETDSDDDDDTGLKTAIIRTKHYLFGSQFGGHQRGTTQKEITLYQKSENQGYEVSAYGGDDQARDAALPSWGPYSFAAMALAGGVAETEKFLRPSHLSGKGVTVEIVVESPVGYEYRGVSMNALPAGPGSRGRT